MNAAPAAVDGSTGPRGEPSRLHLDPGAWKDLGVADGVINIVSDLHSHRLRWSPQVRGELRETAAESVDDFDLLEQLVRKASRPRLTGPVRFVLKLMEYWRLTSAQVVGLLGFDQSDADHVAAVLDGTEMLRGRDVRNRIAYLFAIRATLRSLFRDLDVENEWLREPHALLQGESPLALLSNGSVEDLLVVKDYVDTAAGR